MFSRAATQSFASKELKARGLKSTKSRKAEPLLRLTWLQNRLRTPYGLDSQTGGSRFRRRCGNCADSRRRIRFSIAVAKHRTVPRRTDTRGLRRAVAAEYFLHGAGERRRFQNHPLRPHLAAD